MDSTKNQKNRDKEWDEIFLHWNEKNIHLTIELIREYFKNKDPLNPVLLLVLGDCLTDIFKYDEAIRILRKSLRLWEDDKRFIPLTKIGNMYRKKGQYAAAERWYRKAVEEETNGFNSLILLGAVLGRQGKFKEAKECYKKAIKKGVASVEEPYILLSEILAAEGKYIEAFEYAEKSVNIDPNDEKAVHLKQSIELVLTKNANKTTGADGV